MTESAISDALRKIRVGSTAEWRAAGLTERQIRALVRSGQLAKVRHGAYATAAVLAQAETDAGLRHAIDVAAARARRSGVGTASYHSAARIRELRMLHQPEPEVVTLTVPPRARDRKYRRDGEHRSATGVICHVAELPARQVMKLHGIPLTTAARTVVDIARTSSFIDSVVVADSALYEGRASKTEMRRVLETCASWPGVEAARKVVEFANSLSESVFESCARVRFSQLGLEPPELQGHILNGRGALIARTDFCWRRHHTVAEADGMLKYGEQDDLNRQFTRDRLLREAGWEVVHFTWQELFSDAERVVAQIRAAFGRAARLRG